MRRKASPGNRHGLSFQVEEQPKHWTPEMGHYVPLDADRQKRKGLCDGIANDSSKRFRIQPSMIL